MNEKLFTKLDKGKKFEKEFSWEAPERQWSPKDRAWYVVYSLFFVIFIALAAIVERPLLVVAIIAFVFLWFTQASIPPQIITHTITNLGIRTYGKLFKWKSIQHYWFSVKDNETILNLDIVDKNLFVSERMHRLSLIIDEKDEEKIFLTLLKYVDYGDKEEVDYNFLSKMLYGRYVDVSKYLVNSSEDEIQDTQKSKNPIQEVS